MTHIDLGLMNRGPCPRALCTRSIGHVDLFHIILFRKIIQIILKITGALEFYKKHPKLI
jgi:hypothetical protein